MTLIPPTDTQLGALSIDEVYFEYEGPKFFSAVSAAGARYLALAVSEDEEADTESFLYVAVSPSRFESIRSGALELRHAFTSPEDGILFEVVADYVSKQSTVHLINPEQVDESQLPLEGARLEIPTDTRPSFEPERLTEEANGLGRILVALELEPADSRRTEISLRSLSRLSGFIQDTLDALGQEIAGRATNRGAIPGDVVQATEMVFRESLAASFVVVLADNVEEGKLGPSPLLAEACGRLSQLFSHAQSGDNFRDLLAGYGPRARTKYRTLMEQLSDDGTGVDFFVAQPGQELAHTRLTRERLASSLDVIRETGLEVKTQYIDRAHIIGANIRTRSFEIIDAETGAKYSGYMEPRVRAQVAGLAIGLDHIYSATVLVQQKFSNITDAVHDTYRLVQIGAGPSTTPLRTLHEAVSDDDDE
jgi:hypothetical protein